MKPRRVKAVVFKPSYLCNQDCVMCPHRGVRTPGTRMTQEETFGNLETIRSLYEPSRFEIVGGEPTLFPAFFDVLRWLSVRCPTWPLHVYTNGLQFARPGFVETAACWPVSWVVALHAPDEATHARVTNSSGNFSRLLDGLERASNAGLSLSATVAVLRQNETSLAAINSVISRFGFASVSYRLPVLDRRDAATFKPDVVRFAQRVEDALPALRTGICAEIIMAPRCIGGSVPVNEEKGDVVLVDRLCSAEGGGRLKEHYDNAIVDDLSARRFEKFPSCGDCAYNSQCAGLDSEYVKDLERAGVRWVPLSS